MSMSPSDIISRCGTYRSIEPVSTSTVKSLTGIFPYYFSQPAMKTEPESSVGTGA